MLIKARLNGPVPWEAIEDRARTTLVPRWPDADVFVRVTLAAFLQGYRRDLLQFQERALEVWVEKDALSRIVHQAASAYGVPVVVARGFSSVTYVNACRERIN